MNTMRMPQIAFYCKCYFTAKSITGKELKTPKYVLKAYAGYYPAMNKLKGENDEIAFFLKSRRGDKSTEPPMHLQAKDSLRFTGLKDYYINGKISGYAYGEPSDEPTYGKKEKKTNPFFNNRNDGYLFKFSNEMATAYNGAEVPESFELLIIDGGRVLASSYCKMLQMGGFNDVLNDLRRQAGEM